MTRKLFYLFSLMSLSCLAYGTPFGTSLILPVVPEDTKNFQGFRIASTYQPKELIYEHVTIYGDAGFSHWQVNHSMHQTLNVYSIAPYVRYYILKSTFSPFAEASIGLAYLTKTYLGKRNLGMHFSFQDQLGLGIACGKAQNAYITFNGMHYSNGSLSGHNSGITFLALTLGYRF